MIFLLQQQVSLVGFLTLLIEAPRLEVPPYAKEQASNKTVCMLSLTWSPFLGGQVALKMNCVSKSLYSKHRCTSKASWAVTLGTPKMTQNQGLTQDTQSLNEWVLFNSRSLNKLSRKTVILKSGENGKNPGGNTQKNLTMKGQSLGGVDQQPQEGNNQRVLL